MGSVDWHALARGALVTGVIPGVCAIGDDATRSGEGFESTTCRRRQDTPLQLGICIADAWAKGVSTCVKILGEKAPSKYRSTYSQIFRPHSFVHLALHSFISKIESSEPPVRSS